MVRSCNARLCRNTKMCINWLSFQYQPWKAGNLVYHLSVPAGINRNQQYLASWQDLTYLHVIRWTETSEQMNTCSTLLTSSLGHIFHLSDLNNGAVLLSWHELVWHFSTSLSVYPMATKPQCSLWLVPEGSEKKRNPHRLFNCSCLAQSLILFKPRGAPLLFPAEESA